MSDTQNKPIRFDENCRLSPQDWDRLFSQLDEEIRQAEEAAARKAGWSEECDELWDIESLFREEEEEEESDEEQGDDEEPEEYWDPDDF